MKRYLLNILGVWFVIVPCDLSADQHTVLTFGGMVVDQNNMPVPGAVVMVTPSALQDTTDFSGRFGFENMNPGSYVVNIDNLNSSYFPLKKKVTISENMTIPFTIQLRQREYTVDEVVVVSSGSPQTGQIENQPSHVVVVKRSEFENKAVTVEDVIKATPSANISTSGGLGSFSDVSLRGSYSNQVQIYMDGMLLNEAIGGSVNLGTIPLMNVERIEIWRSGAPAQFGGDAVGGAINIVTRDTRGNECSANLGYGSFNTLTAYGIAGFGNGSSHGVISMDFARSDNDYAYTSDNGTAQNSEDDYTADRKNNEYQTLNCLAKFRSLMKNSILFECSENVLHSQKNQPSTQHILYSDAFLTTTKNLFQSGVTWSPDDMPWLEIVPRVNHIYSVEHYEDKGGHVGWGEQDNIYETGTIQGMIPISVRWDSWGTMSITPTANHESYRPEYRLDTTVPLSCDREHLGLVGDMSVHTPSRHIMLTFNTRRDRYFSKYEGQANVFTPFPPKPQFHHFTNSQVGIKIEPLRNVSLRWNYGDNWRSPSFYELFGDRGGAVSNPNLKPEHAYRWDIGTSLDMQFKSIFEGSRVETAYFENDYRNLIQWYTNNYGFVEPANVAGSYVKGTEIIWNALLFKRMSCAGNWTFQQSKVIKTTKVYHQGKKLPNRPEKYGSCTMEYSFHPVTVFWRIDHKGSYFLDRANQAHKRYPGRTLHDAGLSIRMRKSSIIWQLQVQNLTDRQTFDIQGMPKPGRSFMVTVNYKSL